MEIQGDLDPVIAGYIIVGFSIFLLLTKPFFKWEQKQWEWAAKHWQDGFPNVTGLALRRMVSAMMLVAGLLLVIFGHHLRGR